MASFLWAGFETEIRWDDYTHTDMSSRSLQGRLSTEAVKLFIRAI